MVNTIIARTTITQIRGDQRIRPQSTLWVIVNDGVASFIFNGLTIKTGERFGIDSSLIAPPGTYFENDTEFQITFIIDNTFAVGTPAYALANFQSAKLIETVYLTQSIAL